MNKVEADVRSHAWRHLIALLCGAGKTTLLFELLEQRGFLVGQADFFGDFGRTSADIESFVLPAAIDAENWARFFHYATVALNLRGLAEDLAAPEILQALIREGRQTLALDLAGRLAEPLRRAASLAVIAQEGRNDPDLFRQMLGSINQSLEAPLPAPRDAAEAGHRVELLAQMARLLGSDLTTEWSAWIGKAGLAPEQADLVWRAVAESRLERGEADAPALWETLRQIRDPVVLLDFLPAALGRTETADSEKVLTQLLSLFPDEDHRRRAGLSFLSHLARNRPERAIFLWQHWMSSEVLSWTVELIEAAGPLLALKGPRAIDALAGQLGDPILRAALHVIILEDSHGQFGPAQTDAALSAVEEIPDGPEKLHWALRYLQARSPEPADEIRGQVAAVERYLHEIRYGAPPEDLRRHLDLIALFFTEELPNQIESVLTSPASHPDVLYALVCSAQAPAVLRQVLENAARYASLTALNEAQAWRLRGELLTAAARRLCLLGEDPQKVMEDAVPRLLHQEEDDARSSLVELSIGHPEAAAKIASGIQEGRRRFVAELRAGSADRKNLDPSKLYAIVAHTDSLSIELSGLVSLLGRPDDPDLLDRAPDDRVDLCLRLGWHALTCEAREFQEDWDPRAILSRLEPRLALAADEELVSWTPAIVALAVQPNDRQSVAEVTEAAERIAGLETVSWPVRREALERLLASLPDIFDPLAGSSRTHRRARSALSALRNLHLRLPPGKARDEITERWPEILPMIEAAAERIDRLPKASWRLLPPWTSPSRPSSSIVPPPAAKREDRELEHPQALERALALPPEDDVLLSSGISPSEPGVQPLVRRVWELSSDPLRIYLAKNVVDALVRGGRPQAEAALRWWLHGHLAPRLGEIHEPGLVRAQEAASALARARSLDLSRIERR
jgi:hypothetical protein